MTACNLYGEIPESTTPLSAKDIDVTVSAVTDSAFTVTLAPKGEAAFYSYLVDQDDEAYDLSPEEIYFVDYSSVAEGTVCYAENPTYTFTVDAEPNSQYWIYAVSSATDGNVGKLTVVGVKTTDGVAPEIVDAECKDTTLTLTFSEDVKYDKGIVITAKYYASNLYAKEYLPFVDDSQMMGVDTAKVTVEGNVATCAFPNLPNGAYYAPIVPDGAFVDYAGLKAEGFDNGFKYDTDKKKPVPQGPVYGKVAAAAFAPVLADTLDVMLDYSAYQTLNHPDKYYVSGAVASMVKVKVVEINDAGATVTTESVLSGAPYYGAVSTTSWGVKLKDEPSRGAYVTITIPEKTFYDVYGNYNSEVVIDPLLYSYGYTMDDFVGTYTINSTSGYASYGYGPYANVVTIAKSDDAKKGDVVISGQLSDVNFTAYAAIDTDLGTIEFVTKYPAVVGTCVDVDYDDDDNPKKDSDGNYVTITYDYTLALTTNGSNLYTSAWGFDMASAHSLAFWFSGQAFAGLMELKGGQAFGWYDLLNIGEIEYTPDAKTSAVASSVKKYAPKGFVDFVYPTLK